MFKSGDYQIIEIQAEFQLYLRGDRHNWIFQRTLSSEEVETFIQEQKLTLLTEEGTHGVWPVRNYRHLSGADLVVHRVRNMPTPPRQAEDW